MADNKTKALEAKATIEKKQFKDKETGELVDYFAVSIVVDGTKIPLSIPKESKLLFKHLIGKYFE